MGGGYAHYYGFEVDKDNFLCLKNRIIPTERDTFICKGLYSCNATLYFDKNMSGTQKTDEMIEGSIAMQVVALDDYLQRKKCTMIKLDTEGCELDILKGAEGTIKTYKPKLIVCVYHNYGDCIEIGDWLNSLGIGYNIFLRHQSDYGGESILFAV